MHANLRVVCPVPPCLEGLLPKFFSLSRKLGLTQKEDFTSTLLDKISETWCSSLPFAFVKMNILAHSLNLQVIGTHTHAVS